MNSIMYLNHNLKASLCHWAIFTRNTTIVHNNNYIIHESYLALFNISSSCFNLHIGSTHTCMRIIVL